MADLDTQPPHIVRPGQTFTLTVSAFGAGGITTAPTIAIATAVVGGIAATVTILGNVLSLVIPNGVPLGDQVIAWTYIQVVNGTATTQSANSDIVVVNTAVDTGPITLDGIKSKLMGLENWLDAAAKSSFRYDDARILKNVPAMLRKFERDTGTLLVAKQVIAANNESVDNAYATLDPTSNLYVGLNGLPVRREDSYPFYPADRNIWFTMSLRSKPVQYVQRMRVQLANTQVYTVPPQWLVVDRKSGKVEVIPVNGALALSAGATSFAIIGEFLGTTNYVPNSVQIDYVAGLPQGVVQGDGSILGGWWQQDDYADLLIVIEEFCALQILNDTAYLADAGLSGKGIEGETLSYDRFMQRKAELQASYAAYVNTYASQETPIMMMGA